MNAELTIRRATVDDAELLAEHRAAVWHEVGEWDREELAPQIPIWVAFNREHVAGETYVAFVAEEGGRVVASGAVLLYLMIPRPGVESARAGRVQSVYVVPAARKRGIARAIMENITAYAWSSNLISLTLHPSDGARDLYVSLGFAPADEMVLRNPAAP